MDEPPKIHCDGQLLHLSWSEGPLKLKGASFKDFLFLLCQKYDGEEKTPVHLSDPETAGTLFAVVAWTLSPTQFMDELGQFKASEKLFQLLRLWFTQYSSILPLPLSFFQEKMAPWLKQIIQPVLGPFKVQALLRSFYEPCFLKIQKPLQLLSCASRYDQQSRFFSPAFPTDITLQILALLVVMEKSEPEKRGSAFPPSFFEPPRPPTKIREKKVLKFGELSLTSQEFAIQLTINTALRFRQFQPYDFVHWQNIKTRSPFIMNRINHFNALSSFVSGTILSEPDLKKRIALLDYFIQTTAELRTLRNFESIIAIRSGLNNSAVFRLKKTWAGLSSKSLAISQSLATETASEKSYAELRRIAAEGPCLPPLTIILTDLTFIEDGNVETLYGEPLLLNLYKYSLLYSLLSKFFKLFEKYKIDGLMKLDWDHFFLNVSSSTSDQDQYTQSLAIEPRERA